MVAEMPISMGEFIKEIRQLTERDIDEHTVSEILAEMRKEIPGYAMTTLRARLVKLEEMGRARRRLVSGVTVWKLVPERKENG